MSERILVGGAAGSAVRQFKPMQPGNVPATDAEVDDLVARSIFSLELPSSKAYRTLGAKTDFGDRQGMGERGICRGWKHASRPDTGSEFEHIYISAGPRIMESRAGGKWI